MNFDGLTMRLLVKELNNKLTNSRINRVEQIDKNTIALKLNGENDTNYLVITIGNNPNIYCCNKILELPKEPNGFLMLLRKYFNGAHIESVEQINDDRIIKINLNRLALDYTIENKSIVIELMGKHSNCIFINEDEILEALIHVNDKMSSERQILPKTAYALPPNSNRMSINDFNEEEIISLFKHFSDLNISTAIRHIFNGFGKNLLNELLYRTKLNSNQNISNLTSDELNNLAQAIFNLNAEINANTGIYEYKINEKSSFSPVKLFSESSMPIIHNNISTLIESAINKNNVIDNSVNNLKKILEKAIKKEELRQEKIKKELSQAQELDLIKNYADLLMIYSYLPHEYKNNITVDNYLSETLEKITIPLQKEKSISENAQIYYKKYAKYKKRLEACSEQIKLSQQKIDYLESILYALNQSKDNYLIDQIYAECEDLKLIKKRKSNLSIQNKKNQILSIPYKSGKIFIGRNNKENDLLTNRLAKKHNLWFHALNIPGSHVVLDINEEINDDDILEIASYAAFYSKNADMSKIPVDYTLIKNIKKPPGTPPGFVTYTNQHTVYVYPKNPLKKEDTKI